MKSLPRLLKGLTEMAPSIGDKRKAAKAVLLKAATVPTGLPAFFEKRPRCDGEFQASFASDCSTVLQDTPFQESSFGTGSQPLSEVASDKASEFGAPPCAVRWAGAPQSDVASASPAAEKKIERDQLSSQ